MAGACPSEQEIVDDFTIRKGRVDAEAHNERESKRQRRHDAQGDRVIRRGGDHNEEEGEIEENPREAW